MNKFFFATFSIVVLFSCAVMGKKKEISAEAKGYEQKKIESAAFFIDTVFLGGSDSLKIIYTYQLINNNKILRSIAHWRLFDISKNGKLEYRIAQEVQFKESGKLSSYFNTKDIRLTRKDSMTQYQYDEDKFIIEKETETVSIVNLTHNYTVFLDLYKSKKQNKLVDMTTQKNNDGTPVFDYENPKPIKLLPL